MAQDKGKGWTPGGAWSYRLAGEEYARVLRFDAPDGSDKVYRPIHRDGDGWRLGDPPQWYPYRVDELPQNGRVWIVEGEKAADALWSIGVAATTSAHGSQSAHKTDWSDLAGCDVVVWPDRDDAGDHYAQAVADILAKLNPPATVRTITPPDELPEHGDAADYIDARDSTEPEAIRENVEVLADAVAPAEPEPADASLLYRPYPVGALPQVVRRYVKAASRAIGVESCIIALPLLSMLASCIGTTRSVRLKAAWHEPCILWTSIIGESGTKKTPAQQAVLAPLRRVQRQRYDEHEQAKQLHEQELAEHEEALKDWKKSKMKTGDAPTRPEPPACRRHIISDTTTEAVAPVLQANPRGVLLVRDELAGWFGDMDRYASAKGGDAPRWLSIWSADPITIDRKTTGTTYIHRPAVSITGGIQPGILRNVLRTEHREDGMAARFLLAMPPDKPDTWTDEDIGQSIETELSQIVVALLGLNHVQDADGHPCPVTVGLDNAARGRFIGWFNAHSRRTVEETGDLRAAMGKMKGYAPRLALVLHLIRRASDRAVGELIDVESVEAAIALTEWHIHEARRIYAMLDETDQQRDQRQLVELIQRKGGSINGRELVQSSRRYARVADANIALTKLVDNGLGTWETPRQVGRGGPKADRFTLTGDHAVNVYSNDASSSTNGNSVDVDGSKRVGGKAAKRGTWE